MFKFRNRNQKVIFVVGPTSSGKTAIAIKLAQDIGGEVICADSRTIYQDLNIGTAKPTESEMQGIPHHLLSFLALDQTYSAAQFQSDALILISQIHERGKIPIVCGGTGLYINALAYNYDFSRRGALKNPGVGLEALSLADLQALAIKSKVNPDIISSKNTRRIISAIENGNPPKQKLKLGKGYLIIGLQLDREILRARITSRVEGMLKNGLLQEILNLKSKNVFNLAITRGTSYRAAENMELNPGGIERFKQEFIKNDMQLAKRQATWFKRDKNINWVDNYSAALDLATKFTTSSK